MSEELKVIYLQPECCVDPEFGRVWCEHDSPEPCPDGKRWDKYTIIPEGFALVPIKNIMKVERSSDQSVTIVTTSCRTASEIENVIATYQEGK